jgi:ferric-dicitrate binding protein FerR (iron transport regulator)
MGDRRDGEDEMRRLACAAVWRVRLTEAGLESSAAFEAWLAEDPANEIAWRQVSKPWDLLGEQAVNPEVVAARREALARAYASAASTVPRERARNKVWLSAVAAGVAAIALAAL